MNKLWVSIILALSLGLLLVLKTHEKRSLVPYFKSERSIKLPQFESARKRVASEELHLLKLWESMLTGRVAPLDRWLRNEYKSLALSHVFTPSGFHLSALLFPLFLIFRKKRHKIFFLAILSFFLAFLPGLAALKRMSLIKLQQQFFGTREGFILALVLDILWGSFCDSPAGFTYSFLFLGIIYSGAKGFTLIVWFFLAQFLIAFTQGSLISPLLLLTSPIVNTILAAILPFLFLMGLSLWDWQLVAGIFFLKKLQIVVSFLFTLTQKFPLLEVNVYLLLVIFLMLIRKFQLSTLLLLFFAQDLNLSSGKIPMNNSYEWNAKGEVFKASEDKTYRDDGICVRKLLNGVWFETCSPRRGSRQRKT